MSGSIFNFINLLIFLTSIFFSLNSDKKREQFAIFFWKNSPLILSFMQPMLQVAVVFSLRFLQLDIEILPRKSSVKFPVWHLKHQMLSPVGKKISDKTIFIWLFFSYLPQIFIFIFLSLILYMNYLINF